MKASVSRRGFLQTAGAGTVTMWIPTHASGYTAPRCARRRPPPRRSASRNGSSTRPRCASTSTRWKRTWRRCGRSSPPPAPGSSRRPHAKTHKCPAIAKLQLAAGAIGVCTAKVSEAEALFANGVEKILMTTSQRVGEQDPPRDEDPQGEPHVHPGGRQPEERAGPVRRREGSGHRRRRGRRRRGRHAVGCSGRRTRARAGAARRQAAEPEAARDDQLRRQRPAHQGIHEARRGDAEALRAVAAHLRGDEEGRPQHRDLQRRRHRHLQHHAEGTRRHRRAGRQLHLHGRAVSRDRRRGQRRAVHRLRAVADGDDDDPEQLFPEAAHHRRRPEGADAEQARPDRDRREGIRLHRRLRRVRHDPVRDRQQGSIRSATSSS